MLSPRECAEVGATRLECAWHAVELTTDRNPAPQGDAEMKSDNIKVMIRVRPNVGHEEAADNCVECPEVPESRKTPHKLTINAPKQGQKLVRTIKNRSVSTLTFDHIFDPTATQDDVFDLVRRDPPLTLPKPPDPSLHLTS